MTDESIDALHFFATIALEMHQDSIAEFARRMPRPPAANLEIRDARREEIIQAAARVFATRGVHVAKISEIAQAAGLSHGLIYHYFDSKEALVEAIFERKIDRMRDALATAFDGEGPVLDRIGRACECMIAQTEAEPDLALFFTQAVVTRSLPERLKRRMAKLGKAAYEGLTRMIAEGQASGEIADDVSAESLATALAALTRGLSLFHEVRLGPKRATPPTDVILRLLRPQNPIAKNACPRAAARGPQEES